MDMDNKEPHSSNEFTKHQHGNFMNDKNHNQDKNFEGQQHEEELVGQETQAEAQQEVEGSEGPTGGQENKQENKQDTKEENDFKSRFFYLAAETENMKKRFEREKDNLVKYGNEKILGDLIEVLDNFERTVDALRKDQDSKIQNILVGIDMVTKQFTKVLGKHGLEAVEAVGKEFDPNFHEAVAEREVEGKKDQEILEEYQKGYVLNGRLLRPSRVVVNKI